MQYGKYNIYYRVSIQYGSYYCAIIVIMPSQNINNSLLKFAVFSSWIWDLVFCAFWKIFSHYLFKYYSLSLFLLLPYKFWWMFFRPSHFILYES